MSYFIDRRLNPKGKSLANRQRFLRRARAQIRESVQKSLKEAGVAAIPVSAFYEAAPVTSIARLCFAKSDKTLDEGIARLAKARALSLRAHNAGR